jgi:hypothetical protein
MVYKTCYDYKNKVFMLLKTFNMEKEKASTFILYLFNSRVARSDSTFDLRYISTSMTAPKRQAAYVI